uniref:F-box associated beta-propeller type 3 domain-containing protein n=1 Tax=Aegilops tauschii TaxID=37682 RepID=R7WD71_AEGTA
MPAPPSTTQPLINTLPCLRFVTSSLRREYIFALDSVQPLRNIRCPPEVEQVLLHREATAAVLFRGNLHWHIEQNETESNMMVIFNTTAESFRQMHALVVLAYKNDLAYADLFDMDGVLGMFSCNGAANTIDIWVLQDYESEVWTFKCKIELPVTEIKVLCGEPDNCWHAVVMSVDGELLVLVQYAEWLLQIDMDDPP